MNNRAEKTNFGIYGNGAIGCALGSALQKSGHDILFWDIDEQKCTSPTFETFVHKSEVIIICSPARKNREMAKNIAQIIVKKVSKKTVLSVAKGVEEKFITVDKILEEELGEYCNIGVLFGPMIAEEIKFGKLGFGVLATKTHQQVEAIAEALAASRLVVTKSNDLRTVAMFGVLKNIYSIAFGVSDGLNLGSNFKGVVAAVANQEIKKFLLKNTLHTDFDQALAGLADLLATGYSKNSNNYLFGMKLVSKNHSSDKPEGAFALTQINSAMHVNDYPILNSLVSIVVNGAPAGLLEETVISIF